MKVLAVILYAPAICLLTWLVEWLVHLPAGGVT